MLIKLHTNTIGPEMPVCKRPCFLSTYAEIGITGINSAWKREI